MPLSDNKRIAKNSVMLYVRMMFTMWLNLYATRLILKYLGADDFGIYGVVGSVVGLCNIINSGIQKAVQRFITFEMGKPDGRPKEMFCTLMNIIIIFAVITFLLLEIGGTWFIYNKMNIPVQSQDAAFWVLQFSIAATILSLISNPYNALIIAHEKMNVFAFVSVMQAFLTCAAAFCLQYIPENRLVWYAFFIAVVAVGIRLMYQVYCRMKFPESKYRWFVDKEKMKSIGKFAGWATVDGGLNTITWQGVTIIFNLSFGVAINAVYQIASQVNNSFLSFAQNVQRAVDPQLTKSYAKGDYERHCWLIYNGSKLQVFLIYLLIIPFLIRAEYIMKLWLGEVPEHAVHFCQLAIFMSLVCAGFEVVRTSVIATGNIKKFVLYPNSAHLLLLPLCYLLNRIWTSPELMMVAIVVTYYIIYAYRLWLARKVSVFSLRLFIIRVIVPCCLVGVITAAITYLLNLLLPYNIWGLLLLVFLNAVVMVPIILYFGLRRIEKKQLLTIFWQFIIRSKCKWYLL